MRGLPPAASHAKRGAMGDGIVAGENSDRAKLVDALVRTGAGNRAALADVYRRSSAKLFGICLRILGNEAEAEDTLQDVYINVWRKAASFDPRRASPITWLAAIARNRAIDRLRSSGGRRMEPVEAAAEIADERIGADEMIAASQDSARLGHCLGKLEARHAQAIRSAFWGGATYAELAEQSNVPLGTMKSQIRRSLLRLRDCLGR